MYAIYCTVFLFTKSNTKIFANKICIVLKRIFSTNIIQFWVSFFTLTTGAYESYPACRPRLSTNVTSLSAADSRLWITLSCMVIVASALYHFNSIYSNVSIVNILTSCIKSVWNNKHSTCVQLLDQIIYLNTENLVLEAIKSQQEMCINFVER